MTKVEIGIIVIAALIPIIALVILFPFKKKKKAAPKPAKEQVTDQKPKEEPVKEPDPLPKSGGISTASLDTSEFMDYLKEKSTATKAPERKEFGDNLGEIDDDLFSDIDFSIPRKKKVKSLSQEIQDLSPELKAMIISGVLDRKEY